MQYPAVFHAKRVRHTKWARQSRADRQKLIDQVMDEVLTDEAIGNLAATVGKDQNYLLQNSEMAIEKSDEWSKIEVDTEKLIGELIENGEKCNPDDVIGITKTSDGKIIWLETGTERAGLTHILTVHGDQFAQRGIDNNSISNYIMDAVSQGKIVGYQGKKDSPRPIYEFVYNGEIQRVAVQIGSNGFIVGANPRSMEDVK